jgi:Fe2+ or Zn2+ uptake regulation protein
VKLTPEYAKQYQRGSGEVLPMTLVRNQIKNMLGEETGKITFGRTKYKFRTSSNRISFQLVYNILVQWEGAEFRLLKSV